MSILSKGRAILKKELEAQHMRTRDEQARSKRLAAKIERRIIELMECLSDPPLQLVRSGDNAFFLLYQNEKLCKVKVTCNPSIDEDVIFTHMQFLKENRARAKRELEPYDEQEMARYLAQHVV